MYEPFTKCYREAMNRETVLPLESSEGTLAAIGGKALGLSRLLALGERVPPGFVITTDVYNAARQDSNDAVLTVPEVDEHVIREAYRQLGSPLVAVRSSATAEDLPGAAFAGQQETYLGVLGEEALLEAITDCWASLHSERARSYRNERGIDESEVSIAVVVQQMVDADFAGVMFTADPVTGDRKRVVIESNPGLGEAVVSGLVITDRAVLGEDGLILERRAGAPEAVIRLKASGGVSTERGQGEARLEEAQLKELAAAGRRIRDGFDRPMDIEWATVGSELYILQARPMTALPPAPRKLGSVERKVAPMLYELLPQRPTPMEVDAWITPGIAKLVARMMGGIAGVHVDYSASLVREDGIVTEFVPTRPKPTLATPLRIVQALGQRPLTGGWRNDPLYATYLRQCSELDRLPLRDLPWRELVEIPSRACSSMQLVAELRVKYLRPAVSNGLKLVAALAITGQLELLSELSITPHTETHRINERLSDIAAELTQNPEAMQMLTQHSGREALAALNNNPATAQLASRIDEFLMTYGHRESASLLLPRVPTWGADPTPVTHLLGVLGNGGHESSAGDQHALERLLAHPLLRAQPVAEKVRSWVHGVQEFIAVREDTHFEITRTMPVVRAAIEEMGRRLYAGGGLQQFEDVWFLDYAVLRQASDEILLCAPNNAHRAGERRRRHDELAAAPLISPATLYDLSPVSGALLHGTGSGGGRVTAPVRLVHSAAEFDRLLPGEILVCPATNPSWTPLFARAAGVVVDHGSAGSHAAIVAREYRIPAVMGCASGTTTLTDGQWVTVDGDRGLVLEAKNEHAN